MANSTTVRVDQMAAWLHGVTEHQVEVVALAPWEAIRYPTSEPLFRARNIQRVAGAYAQDSYLVFDLAGEVFEA